MCSSLVGNTKRAGAEREMERASEGEMERQSERIELPGTKWKYFNSSRRHDGIKLFVYGFANNEFMRCVSICVCSPGIWREVVIRLRCYAHPYGVRVVIVCLVQRARSSSHVRSLTHTHTHKAPLFSLESEKRNSLFVFCLRWIADPCKLFASRESIYVDTGIPSIAYIQMLGKWKI